MTPYPHVLGACSGWTYSPTAGGLPTWRTSLRDSCQFRSCRPQRLECGSVLVLGRVTPTLWVMARECTPGVKSNQKTENNMKTYTIKPLEWEEHTSIHHSCHPADSWYSLVFIDGQWSMRSKYYYRDTKCDSLAHGKQLAEADWQARILPALEEVRG